MTMIISQEDLFAMLCSIRNIMPYIIKQMVHGTGKRCLIWRNKEHHECLWYSDSTNSSVVTEKNIIGCSPLTSYARKDNINSSKRDYRSPAAISP
ncbi:Hypothetical predicted protein [Octopus vulgaris]|uniref:Uncharacterized protein n=1 Tax=Octopus vulgaris TaxID=6645 RepID=A0AA36F3C8_OCTVU|nr:Hypothetical predicted protein [Octopus vulgaris]